MFQIFRVRGLFREQIAPGLLTLMVFALLLEASYLGGNLDIKLGLN